MNDATKLKVAAEEIKEILRKHDIAAAVSLHCVGHGEFFIYTHTSYSCAYQIETNMMRIRAKRDEFTSAEEHIEKVSATSNMFKILLDCVGTNFTALRYLSTTLDEITKAVHTDPHTPNNIEE